MKYSSLILVIALVACGSSNGDEMHDAMNSDAGTSPSSDDGGASESASKIDKITEPKTDSMRTTLEDAGTQADAGSEQQPAADAGPSEGMGGSGAAGAPAVEGQAGAPASAGHDAAGAGGMGGSAAGAGGAAGSSSSSACPGGDTDADANGYPDACEHELWTGSVSASNKCVIAEMPAMPVWLMPECGQPLVSGPHFGDDTYAMPSASTAIAPVVTGNDIVAVETDDNARAVADCLKADTNATFKMIGVFGTTGHAPDPTSVADYVRNDYTPHLAGKHIVYFKIEFSTYVTKSVGVSSAICNNQNGTSVQTFSAKVTAYGY